MQDKFIASQVVMIKPMSFCSNPETQDSNSFQTGGTGLENSEVLKKAQTEFLNFQEALTNKGIEIKKYTEATEHFTPDALFPNNWFCHLPDKRAFIFPMQAANRQLECREDIVYALRPREIIDLRFLIESHNFLEGTGSLILDHQNKLGFACLSNRTTPEALNVFSELSGYEIISFDSVDANNQAIYHSNVMMALGSQNAIINLSSIRDPEQRLDVVTALELSGRKIVDISFEEMNHFVGNMLFLRNKDNQKFWVCSEKAYKNLSEKNKTQLLSEAEFIYADLNTIETYGGGGARCLMAEVF